MTPKQGEIWIHKQKQQRYFAVSVSNLNSENPKFIPTVTYYHRFERGELLSRPLTEFLEKFEKMV